MISRDFEILKITEFLQPRNVIKLVSTNRGLWNIYKKYKSQIYNKVFLNLYKFILQEMKTKKTKYIFDNLQIAGYLPNTQCERFGYRKSTQGASFGYFQDVWVEWDIPAIWEIRNFWDSLGIHVNLTAVFDPLPGKKMFCQQCKWWIQEMQTLKICVYCFLKNKTCYKDINGLHFGNKKTNDPRTHIVDTRKRHRGFA